MVRRFERYGCAAPPPTGAKAAAAAAPAVGGFQYPMDDLEHAKHEASRGRAHVVRRPLGGCASAFGVPPAAVADVLQVTDFFRVFGGTALGGVPPFAPADLGAAISMLCATSNHSSANDGGGDAAAPDGAVPSRAAVVSSRSKGSSKGGRGGKGGGKGGGGGGVCIATLHLRLLRVLLSRRASDGAPIDGSAEGFIDDDDFDTRANAYRVVAPRGGADKVSQVAAQCATDTFAQFVGERGEPAPGGAKDFKAYPEVVPVYKHWGVLLNAATWPEILRRYLRAAARNRWRERKQFGPLPLWDDCKGSSGSNGVGVGAGASASGNGDVADGAIAMPSSSSAIATLALAAPAGGGVVSSPFGVVTAARAPVGATFPLGTQGTAVPFPGDCEQNSEADDTRTLCTAARALDTVAERGGSYRGALTPADALAVLRMLCDDALQVQGCCIARH